MWILPSLGRPHRLKALAEATQSPITVRLHQGDPKLDEYLETEWPETWTIRVGPKKTLVQSLNEAFHQSPSEDSYGFIADDCIPRPDHWHETLEEAAKSNLIAYPDDTIHSEKLCTHFCIGGDLVRQMGWLALPTLNHYFIDNVWLTIGRKLDKLRYTPSVTFQHDHPIRNPNLNDSTYTSASRFTQKDSQTFQIWLETFNSSNI